MSKKTFQFIVLSACLLAFSPAFGQNFVVGKFGGDFLSVGGGARPLGMGSAFVAISDDVTAGYWNPAGLTQVDNLQAVYMHSERFSGIVSYDYGAAALPIKQSNGVIGISFFRQSVDDIKNTLGFSVVDGNPPNIDEFPEFSTYDLAFFLSYADRINENVSWGLNGKILNQSIGPFADAWGYSLDVAFLYRNNGFSWGLNLMDITTMLKFWDVNSDNLSELEENFNDVVPEGQNELVLPTIKTGAAKTFGIGEFDLTAALDADLRFENRQTFYINVGKMSIEPHLGTEFVYKDIIALRAGLTDFFTDQSSKLFVSPTFGAGLNFKALNIDYGFGNFSGLSDDLGTIHRISLLVKLDPNF